ncbi:MAG: NAD(P)-binding domain-containing protein [Bdellovibrionales bacterium]|nr:NAD(P)-binding domain-containing protein [Bdellovibrionales bacterium]
MTTNTSILPVAIIGAGPVGLAAAAHLIQRGLEPLVLESGSQVADHFRQYGHVRLFSPWKYNIDKAASRLLQEHGWNEPEAQGLPTAREAVENYLDPLAALPELAGKIRLRTRVVSISREGFDKVKTKGREISPFVIRVQGPEGQVEELKARAVIDASGTWSSPNPLGANGLQAIGEPEHADQIFYGIPDALGTLRARYAGRTTLVVGSGHSAANSLLALAELAQLEPGTEVLWAVRGTDLNRVFGGGAADALPARGQLGIALSALQKSGKLTVSTDFRIDSVEGDDKTLTVTGHNSAGEPRKIEGIHEIVCATGQRPDYSMARELRLKLDPWLESSEALGPLIDPNLHSCGTVRPHGHKELAHPEPGFYTAGVKSYGRAPTFLMATGYEQVRSIASAIAGDIAAADDVQLDLPETGVCSVSFSEPKATAGCCEVPSAAAPVATEAGCCTTNSQPTAKPALTVVQPAGSCCG